jgi:hypothetical protein
MRTSGTSKPSRLHTRLQPQGPLLALPAACAASPPTSLGMPSMHYSFLIIYCSQAFFRWAGQGVCV